MASALVWFPLVGCGLGVLLYRLGLAVGFISGDWAGGTAAIVLSAGVVLTRGLHLDGLADWADGCGGGREREDTLAIMKDPHVGAFGVLAITVSLLIKYVALLRLINMGYLYWMIHVLLVSRATMAELAVCLPYARPEGGTAGPFVNGARPYHRVGVLLLSLLMLIAYGRWQGVGILVGGWIVGRLLGFWFRRRVGGVTGDLLGACGEIVETGLLLSCAIAGPWFSQLPGGWIF